ncbi:MAG TPA: class I SAM-dependent methyltransferase [Isosphaeraceae bacterium]|nr:class I SAM-dependent methyltransferase [Isosphaeraceae bacterium]
MMSDAVTGNDAAHTIPAQPPAAGCPACGESGRTPGPVYNGWQLVRCTRCGLVLTETRDIPESLYDDIYLSNNAYINMMEASDRTAAGTWGYRELSWFKRTALRWLESNARGRRLVDVGCGPGTFLLVAKGRGWTVAGVEPTQGSAARADRHGLAVHCGVAESFAEGHPGEFDAATCFEVLEHLTEPVETLRAIRRLLVPGGIFVLSVPNVDDPYCLKVQIQSAMPPVHINFFHRKSLRAALERAGFEVLRFRTIPIPTSSVRNHLGPTGFLVRIPWLLIRSAIGQADGTTLLAMARRGADR